METVQPARAASDEHSAGGGGPRRERHRWPAPLARLILALAFIGLGALWMVFAYARPSYDAFGWLVWGKQTLAWNLNLGGAPSWKPLAYLFTLPYALFGRTQLTLWTVTASAAAFSSAWFAARVAYRLTLRADSDSAAGRRRVDERWPGMVAGVLAGAGTVGLRGLSHQMLITTADPMVVAICLAAIDAHLSARPRLCFGLLVLASLGRPETWLFTGLYAAWLWRLHLSARLWLVAGLLLIPAGWFVIPGFTSKSWFSAGNLALHTPGTLHHDQWRAVLAHFFGLYELPIRLCAFAAILVAAVWRDRTLLLLTLCAAVWVGLEIALAYHGWVPSARYMMEAAAVVVVVLGAVAGRLLRLAATRRGLHLLGVVPVIALVVLFVPMARHRIDGLPGLVIRAHRDADEITRLERLVDGLGGPKRVEYCGEPVTVVGFQSTAAWVFGRNVGNVGYKPGREIASGVPIVLFIPDTGGWTVRPVHTLPGRLAACSFLSRR